MRFPVRLLRAIEPPDPQRRQARALPSTASERLDDRSPAAARDDKHASEHRLSRLLLGHGVGERLARRGADA
jgi:hypothetical protein